MSVTEYELEYILIQEELEKLRQEYGDDFINTMDVARKIERLLKQANMYIKKARRLMRVYE
mgnify:CR=1 FL=1